MTRGAAWWRRIATGLVISTIAAACADGPEKPASLSGPNEACRYCRMAVSNQRFAGQIVAPGEEPVFFDDIGCLSNYVQGRPALPRGAVVYVADHRTREWVSAAEAIFTMVPGLETPMASHLIAHASGASLDADPVAAGGSRVALSTLFPGGLLENRR
jgi:copper chaperone NosL